MTESDDNELRLAQARPRQKAPQTDPTDLTLNGLNVVSLYVIGIASEGGRNPYSLAFAGKEKDGLLYPVDKSGITIGIMQTDMGARPWVATELVNTFQEWAKARRPELLLTPRQRTEAIADLSRDAAAIIEDGRTPLDPQVKRRLNTFLGSEQGMNFVHRQDVRQVEELNRKVYGPLSATRVYDYASVDDQIRMAAVMGKLHNQNPKLAGKILDRVENGDFRGFAALNAAVTASGGRSILSGRDAALEGAEVMIALRNSDRANPLRDAWGNVMLDPLIRPTVLDDDRARPNLEKQHAVIKELFIQRQQAPGFIDALDHGGVYRHGRSPDGTRFTENGLYASGNNFAIWNNRGEGIGNIKGVWREFDRDDLTKVTNRDGTIDLRLRQNGRDIILLHVDPKTPAQGRRADLMTDPDHVANPNWQQAQQAMRLAAIDPSEKLTPDQRERVTAGVVAGVLADTRTNMSGIDQIDASTIADPQTGLPKYLIAGQGDPTTAHYRRVAVDVSEALNTPVEQSSEVAKSAIQTREQAQEQQLAQAQTLNQDGPSGPTMRIGARGAGGGDSG